jgi:hypothetical protein
VAQSEKRFRWPRFGSLACRRCRPLPAPSPCARCLRCCARVTRLSRRCCVGVSSVQGWLQLLVHWIEAAGDATQAKTQRKRITAMSRRAAR